MDSEDEVPETALARILLVDDFEPCRNLVRLVLKAQPGYEIVGEAADGLQALQKAEELKPDLIVLDISLPEVNGIELARRIRRCSPDSTILFLSANNDREIVREALQAGGGGYVHKFDLVVDLASAAKAVLSGRPFLSRRFLNRDISDNC